MYQNEKKGAFVAYEYKDVSVPAEQSSFYLDCYENFGWMLDNRTPLREGTISTTLRLKRDRKIANKMELTRLQRNFEACINEIGTLEKSKTSAAMIWGLVIGLIGISFIAGSVFSIVGDQPIIWLCVLLAIPGLAFCGAAYFVYRIVLQRKTEKVTPLIEAKYDEICMLCEKGHGLL